MSSYVPAGKRTRAKDKVLHARANAIAASASLGIVQSKAYAPSQKKQESLSELGETDNAIALVLLDKLIEFRERVCSHETYEHQRKWLKTLVTGKTSAVLAGIAGENTLILAPRDSAKSTTLLEWLAFQIGIHTLYGYPLRIVYVSYKKEIAQQKGTVLQRIIESDAYKQYFPCIRPGNKWSTEQWEIDWKHAGLPQIGEPYTFAACGITGGIVSLRADLILFDDLIKSEVDIQNPLVRTNMITNYRSSVQPLLRTGGRMVALGTMMRGDDIYQLEMTNPEDWDSIPSTQYVEFTSGKNWLICRQPAIMEDPITGEEKSFWEPDYTKSATAYGNPLSRLREIRDRMFSTFMLQYQNHPLTGETSKNPILLSMVREAGIPELSSAYDDSSKFDVLCVGADLASSLSMNACFTALVLGGFKFHKQRIRNTFSYRTIPVFHILDSWEGKLVGNIDKLKVLVDLYFTWKHLGKGVFQFWAENNAYQASLEGDFKTFVQGELGLYDIGIKTLTSKGQISDRLQGISGPFQSGLVFFNPDCTNLSRIKQQLLTNDPATLNAHRLRQSFANQNILGEVMGTDTSKTDLLQALILCMQGLRSLSPLSSASWLDPRTRPVMPDVENRYGREDKISPDEDFSPQPEYPPELFATPTKDNAAQRANWAIANALPIDCTYEDWKYTVAFSLRFWAERYEEGGNYVMRDRCLVEWRRLDSLFYDMKLE